jgi:hypothetical protein
MGAKEKQGKNGVVSGLPGKLIEMRVNGWPDPRGQPSSAFAELAPIRVIRGQRYSCEENALVEQ